MGVKLDLSHYGKKHEQRVTENSVLTRIFAPKDNPGLTGNYITRSFII
jgi:hypothetical protein